MHVPWTKTSSQELEKGSQEQEQTLKGSQEQEQTLQNPPNASIVHRMGNLPSRGQLQREPPFLSPPSKDVFRH